MKRALLLLTVLGMAGCASARAVRIPKAGPGSRCPRRRGPGPTGADRRVSAGLLFSRSASGIVYQDRVKASVGDEGPAGGVSLRQESGRTTGHTAQEVTGNERQGNHSTDTTARENSAESTPVPDYGKGLVSTRQS
jgi:hypothetical protein